MEASTAFWSIDFALLEFGDYTLSLIELLAVVFSLLSTYLLRNDNRLGWVLAILANVCFFLFFYQIRLYAMMAVQVILCCFNVIWGLKTPLAQGSSVKKLDSLGWPISIIATIMPSMTLIIVLSNLSHSAPDWFPLPATSIFADAVSAMGSIVATVLLRRQFLESWIFWVVIHCLLIIALAWKGFYLAMMGQMAFLGYAANEYLAWRNLVK